MKKNKITRKRVRSKYYPEKREGQEKTDIDTFYKTITDIINTKIKSKHLENYIKHSFRIYT